MAKCPFDSGAERLAFYGNDITIPEGSGAHRVEEVQWPKRLSKGQPECALIHIGSIPLNLFMWELPLYFSQTTRRHVIEDRREKLGNLAGLRGELSMDLTAKSPLVELNSSYRNIHL
jgi:hypothetical protein